MKNKPVVLFSLGYLTYITYGNAHKDARAQALSATRRRYSIVIMRWRRAIDERPYGMFLLV